MQPNILADSALAASGQQRIDWVRQHMPVLRQLESRFAAEQPFAGKRIVVCVHLEAKTAYLALVLRAGGAQVAVTGSNPDSTKDNVVAALAAAGLHVYARHGATVEQLHGYMETALELRPHIIIDDGGDVVELLHENHPDLLADVWGACEETTTGVMRARERAAASTLEIPVVLVNEARCKYLFDNIHGTGQSVWDAVMRTTNMVVAGKVVVIIGFGWCGQGCALRAKGLGARVIVCEIDPVKAADATMHGYEVMPAVRACELAHFVITVTGQTSVLRREHFEVLRDGAVLANAGHFWDEIDRAALKSLAQDVSQPREQVAGFKMPSGSWLYLLGDGHIVNIACGDGHPAEVMDTSFALQALSAHFLVSQPERLAGGAYPVPEAIDSQVAALKLAADNIEFDSQAG